MPTPKEVRKLYLRLVKIRWRFHQALSDAHHKELIVYTDSKDSPCQALSECWDRVRRTTEKQLADAIREEIGY